LAESDWGSVTEFGEDYALWLRNIRHEHVGDSIRVTLDLELRSGSLFEEGDLISTRSIVATYDPRDDWKMHAGADVVRLVRSGESCVALAKVAGELFHPAVTAVAERLVAEAEELMPEDYEGMKLEAMVVGSEVVRAAREMTRSLAHDAPH
jgi:hypothetical protein